MFLAAVSPFGGSPGDTRQVIGPSSCLIIAYACCCWAIIAD